jgi:hypothetical protein
MFGALLVVMSTPGLAESFVVTAMRLEGNFQAPELPVQFALSCGRGNPPAAEGSLHGHSGQPNSCWISKLDVSLAGRPIAIPPKAFTDLANPQLLRGVSFDREASEIAVCIKGGDGESAYEACFFFVGDKFDRREIHEFDVDGEWVKSVQRFEPEIKRFRQKKVP